MELNLYSAPMTWFCMALVCILFGCVSGGHFGLLSPIAIIGLVQMLHLQYYIIACSATYIIIYSYTAWPSLYLVAPANTFTDEYLH